MTVSYIVKELQKINEEAKNSNEEKLKDFFNDHKSVETNLEIYSPDFLRET